MKNAFMFYIKLISISEFFLFRTKYISISPTHIVWFNTFYHLKHLLSREVGNTILIFSKMHIVQHWKKKILDHKYNKN